MKIINRALIYNNNLYFYDFKKGDINIISCDNNCLKDNKIYDLDIFIKTIKANSSIKKITNKLVGENLEFIFWNNYSEVDKKVLIEVFNNLNFSQIELKNIKNYLKNTIPNLVVSLDGVYYISEIESYFNYISHNDSVIETIDFIKEKYNIKKYILIGNRSGLSLVDEESFMYENNKTFFEDLLRNMD